MIEHEEWRDIEGYPNYQVSNKGRVRSLNYYRTGNTKVLKAGKNNYGYPQVWLFRDGNGKLFRVHRLVADAFLQPVEGKDQVDHISGIRDDARVENLRYCTHKENMSFELCRKHMSESQKEAQNRPEVNEKRIGKNNPMARAVIQLTLNGEFIKRFDTARDAERDTGFNNSHIAKCCKGKLKTTGGFKWRYEKS